MATPTSHETTTTSNQRSSGRSARMRISASSGMPPGRYPTDVDTAKWPVIYDSPLRLPGPDLLDERRHPLGCGRRRSLSETDSCYKCHRDRNTGGPRRADCSADLNRGSRRGCRGHRAWGDPPAFRTRASQQRPGGSGHRPGRRTTRAFADPESYLFRRILAGTKRSPISHRRRLQSRDSVRRVTF